MPLTNLFVFSSTPDVVRDNFVVPLHTAPLDALVGRAVELGFDGLEFLPNPDDVPDGVRLSELARAAGGRIGVINSGRLPPNDYALLHRDPARRRLSMQVFKRLIDLAGSVGARVGLGMARGDKDMAVAGPDLEPVMRDVFAEIADHAAKAKTFVMLEPADPGYVAAVLRVREALEEKHRVNSPGFSIMLDTYQLDQIEDSIEGGFADARGEATHIHLYDHQHWPPGVREPKYRLDWERIRTAMQAHGFTGTGSTVMAPEGDTAAAARVAVAFIRKMLITGGAK